LESFEKLDQVATEAGFGGIVTFASQTNLALSIEDDDGGNAAYAQAIVRFPSEIERKRHCDVAFFAANIPKPGAAKRNFQEDVDPCSIHYEMHLGTRSDSTNFKWPRYEFTLFRTPRSTASSASLPQRVPVADTTAPSKSSCARRRSKEKRTRR